jgi:hypothetical protein
MRTTNHVTATDNVIDLDTLVTVTGGVKPGPNGEGCTGPFPRPRPSPFPRPLPGGPVTDPAQQNL